MTQGKRLLQKETTREKIIQTTMRLYLINGISTTTDMVAKEAELSHGTVFVHFPTREDLQIQVLRRLSQEMGNKIHDLSEIGDDLPNLLLSHLSILEEYEYFYTDLIMSIKILSEEARNMVINFQSILSHHFSTAIEKGWRDDKIKNIPLHMMFNSWLGLVHYYLINACIFAPGQSVLKCYKKELVDNFMVLISK